MFDMNSIIEELVERLAELVDKMKITKEKDGVVVRFTDPAIAQAQDTTNPLNQERLAQLKRMVPGAADLDFEFEPMADGFKLKTKDPAGVHKFITTLLDPERLVAMLRQAMPRLDVRSVQEKRAIEELKRKTDENPDDFDRWIELAEVYLQVNELYDAAKCAEKAADLVAKDFNDPRIPKLFVLMAKISLVKDAEEPSKCLMGILVAVALNRKEPSVWKCLGAAYMLNNEPGHALCAFETAGALGFKDAEGLAKAKKEAKAKLGSASYDAKKAKADIDQQVEDAKKGLLAEVERAKAYEKERAERAARAVEEQRAKEEAAAAKKKAKEEAAAKKKAAAKPSVAKPAKATAAEPAGKKKK